MPEHTADVGAAELLLSMIHSDPRVAELLVLALERALVRDGVPIRLVGLRSPETAVVAAEARVDPAKWTAMVAPEIEESVSHVADWLVSSVAGNAAWLSRTDREGRPVKLTKIGSLDRAVHEADKAMIRFAASVATGTTVEGESVHRELGDGWKLVRMDSPKALDAESARMQHCIGQGAYDDAMLSGSRMYLSLRDPAGHPHATMEVDVATRRLLQLRGKQNRVPIPRYVRLMRDFLSSDVQADNRYAYATGFVVAVDGSVHDLDDLPDVLDAKGSLVVRSAGDVRLPKERLSVELEFSVAAGGGGIRLPRTLEIGGDTSFADASVDFGECGTASFGSLKFERCEVSRLPHGLTIGADMVFSGTPLDALPDGLVVKRKLVLGDNTPQIPGDAKIGELVLTGEISGRIRDGASFEKLTFRDATFAAFPRDLEVGSLSFEKCGPVAIPDDLVVRRDLSATDCTQGFVLPRGFSIAGGFSVMRGGPAAIPDGTRIGGRVWLRDASVSSIGKDVVFGDELRIDGTRIVDLPRGLVVGGTLEILDPGLRSIGEHTRIGRRLLVKVSGLEELPDGLETGGDVEIFAASAIASIGARTRIGGALAIPGSEIEELPEDLVAAGPLCLAEDMDFAPFPAGIRDSGVVLYSRPKDRVGPKARAPDC